ncbi:MAG TPA: EAL domain-containing protein [Candidatus Limnocylindria bacterium]|nr:EAL domain-containing protein [Candidatus Limnocylindria bacterium]
MGRGTQRDEGELADELAQAIERGEFRLEYQPIVRLGSGALAGAEALVRWRHPRRGTIPPNEFLPVAQAAGLIAGIGNFVLEEACRIAVGWPKPADRASFVSINVVPAQLADAGWSSYVLGVVADTGLDPHNLVLEMTGGAGGEAEAIEHSLESLREAGVRFALDDFGHATTLHDVKLLPVDLVKLDREFVAGVDGPPNEAAFALSLLGLADARGIEVVAKGIESREQAWRLAELGCRYGQGYFFSKPLGASGILAVLRQGVLRS